MKKTILFTLFFILVLFTANNIFAANITEVEARRVYQTYSSTNPPTNQRDIAIWNAMHQYQEGQASVTPRNDEFYPGFLEEARRGTYDRFFTSTNQTPTSGDIGFSVTSGSLADSDNPTSSHDPTDPDFQLVPAKCFGDGTTAKVENKNFGKCGWTDLIIMVNIILRFMVYIAASLSAIAFAYAGFLYMTAGGNSGKIEQAHGIFKKTMAGIFCLLLGWLIVATILKTLGVKNSFSLIDLSEVEVLDQQ